jgi:hypothetical protein
MNTIRVLSYNIYFRAMIPNNLPACNPILTHNLPPVFNYTTCLKNVAAEVNRIPYDFIGLQEATNWQHIQKLSPNLTNMTAENYKPGVEDIVTFYGKKYTLDPATPRLPGYMENIGRPFIILFFAQNICVINIHAEHNQDIYNLDQYIIRALSNPTYQPVAAQMVKKFKSYDIIMMGDFNDNLQIQGGATHTILTDPYFGIPGGRKLFGINKQNTCCDANLTANQNVMKNPYDHILSTWQK